MLILILTLMIAGSSNMLSAEEITLKHLYTTDTCYGGQRFVSPVALFFDARRHEVYISDAGSGVIAIFAQNGKPVGSFKHRRKGGESANEPVGVLVDEKGTVYVSDASSDRIYMYDYAGQPDGYLQMPKETGGPLMPGKLAVDASGNIHVAVRDAGMVVVFTPDGTFKAKMTFPSEDKAPESCDVAVDSLGKTFALSPKGMGIHVLDGEGKQVREFGDHGVGDAGFSRPSGIDVDSKGRLWVTDSVRQVVKVFHEDGKFLAMFGGLGSGTGDFFFPADVCVDRTTNTLFVLEKNGRRFQAFAIEEK